KRTFPHVTWTQSFQEKITTGLEKLVWVFQDKYLTKNHIAEGFSVCGQHRDVKPYFVDVENPQQGLSYSSVDPRMVLCQTYKKIEED
ncbi:hypothetical protein ABTM90_19925, partial [Acinetobacter baumannii]